MFYRTLCQQSKLILKLLNNNMFKAQNRYKVCSSSKAINYIDKCLAQYDCQLSDQQKYALRQKFGDSGALGNLDMDVQFYTWEKETEDGKSMLWRFTIPFFFIFCLFLHIIVFPIHWIISGKYTLGNKSKILNFAFAWQDKLFKRWK